MDPAFVNGKRVDFHVFDLAGSIGADVMITDPNAPSYVQKGLDESRLLRERERAKREKHVLNVGIMLYFVSYHALFRYVYCISYHALFSYDWFL